MILVGDWAPNHYSVKLDIPKDIYLANLEGPILSADNIHCKTKKAGPHLFSNTIPDEYNFIFSLANNHIMDYGLTGLEFSKTTLKAHQILSCGAGDNFTEARKPLIIEEGGIKLGIIACCEAQFGVANTFQPGVAEFGSWIYQTIRDIRPHVNHIIISVHAAIEESPWPSPYLREIYHSWIDAGASIIHGHHAHIPQGFESYKQGMIFYGLGNFAVNPEKWCQYPNGMWSLAARIMFDKNSFEWEILTFEIRSNKNSNYFTVEESNNTEKLAHLNYLQNCNEPLNNPSLFLALWQETSVRTYCHHSANYLGFSRSLKSRLAQFIKQTFSTVKNSGKRRISTSQSELLLWYHLFACESHRQTLATSLGVLSGEIKDLRTVESSKLADLMMPWSVGITS
ncbi:MAG: hypothetical protein DCF12_13850 [Snowella sp.]|jgi:poly-gamma-glutamate synthesis protein (capsule biosynthesis protein)|nr:MAG: hypothetical protein DCF12_13850 [Snowella sp.]